MRTTLRQARSGEDGMALVLTMFMVLLVSLLGAAVMVSARTETLSSMNYRTMAQARYGAESGVHHAINYLLNTYAKPGTVGDPLTGYTMTQSPVKSTVNNADVILSSTDVATANYPIAAVKTAFNNAVRGNLTVSNGVVAYTAKAKLLSMRQITDVVSGLPVTVQSWEITGTGTLPGAGSSAIEVSAVLETPVVPMFRYAAFSTAPGCDSMSFAGGAETNSYDSRNAVGGGGPTISNSDGNVGSNGNLSENGNTTTIWGTLSTPRSGVGNCTANNVTAQTISGNASVEGGLIQLPQPVTYPAPAALTTTPPTTSFGFNKNSGCAAGVTNCVTSSNGATITPPSATSVITMGNVSLGAQAELHLGAGIYEVNSITMNGNATIIVDSGPVIFRVAGVGQTTPIDLVGGAVSNPTFVSTNLQFQYAGTGGVKVAGGAQNSMLLYAPSATTTLSGNSDFYGALVTGVLTATGGVAIHYDRALERFGLTSGNTVMSEFTWKAF